MNFIIDNLVEILFTLLVALVTFLYKKVKALINLTYANKDSMLVISENLFITKYCYFKRQNSISVLEKETINNLYKEYKKLGGEGIVDNLIKKFNEIPLNNESVEINSDE